MSVKKITLELISGLVEETAANVQKWKMDDKQKLIEYRKDGMAGTFLVRAMPVEVQQSFMRLIDGTADLGCEVSDDAKLSLLSMDDFAAKYKLWLRRVSVFADSPEGSGELWASWERLLAVVRTRPVYAVPMPVKTLIDTYHSSYDQIARIYGWLDDQGYPDSRKVLEEYEKPGTHFDPKTWIGPAQRNNQVERERRWAERQGPRAKSWESPTAEEAKAAQANEKPPKTQEQLDAELKAFIEAGGTAEQTSRLFKIPLAIAAQLVEEERTLRAMIAEEQKRQQESLLQSNGSMK